jgi:hypothetical protein
VIVIERRFRGPPESGQGGYTCGVLAREIDGAAEVTLRKPPPLERELTLESDEGGRHVLRDAHTILAEAMPTTLEIDTPPPVELGEAKPSLVTWACCSILRQCASGVDRSGLRETGFGCSRVWCHNAG